MRASKSFLLQAGLLVTGFVAAPLLLAQVPVTVDPHFQPVVRGGPGVLAVATQPDGKVLLGGNFASVNAQPRRGIVRLNVDGSVESSASFDPGVGANGVVNALALQADGKILLGGTFSAVNGQPRGRIARLYADGRVEGTLTFNPGTGVDSGIVFCVAVQPDGKILVGGDFTSLNGQPRQRIARLRSDGSLEEADTFNPGSGVEGGVVRAIRVTPDGRILLAGSFVAVNGQPRKGIARIEADGTLESATSFHPGAGVDGTVHTMAVQPDGRILLGGDFATVDGQPRAGLARLNEDGNLESSASFNPGAGVASGGIVRSLALEPDGRILVVGEFTGFNHQPRNNIARLLPNGSLESSASFAPGANGAVYSVAIEWDGSILLGGLFTGVNGQARDRVARLTNQLGRYALPAYEAIGAFADAPDGPTSIKGRNPLAGMVSDKNGFLWGTTYFGGIRAGAAVSGNGTIYKLKPATGALSTIAEFTGTSGAVKGRGPVGALADEGNGFLWGVTERGGSANVGTVFKIAMATGALTTVVEFTGSEGPERGALPCGGLTSDGRGSFWGTTKYSGQNAKGNVSGFGTVFKISSATGILTSVVAFTGPAGEAKGMNPSPLARDREGFFWGTTGGPERDGSGTIFKVDAATGLLTTVVEFSGLAGPARGRLPSGGLHDDTYGSFWGVTHAGGSADLGTVFKVNAATGALTTVLEFTGDGGPAPGGHPSGGLVRDQYGYFWGTTERNATGLFGSVFRISPIGGFTHIANFTGVSGDSLGGHPNGPLVFHTDGNLYGTTREGGLSVSGAIGGGGQIYRLRFNCLTSTQAAIGIGATTATLRGTLSPAGHDCSANFELGTDPTLAMFTSFSAGTASSDAGKVPFSLSLTDLNPGTVYYYRLTATEVGNAPSRHGTIISFRTSAPPDAAYHPFLGDEVFALALQPDGRSIAGGAFLNATGALRRHLARFAMDGSLDAGFAPDIDGRVYATAVEPNGAIVVAGAFSGSSGQPRQNLVRLLPDGSPDAAFDPDPDERVLCLAPQIDGKLIIGGGFATAGGVPRPFIARLNGDGSVDDSFNPRANSSVLCLAIQDDDKIIVGGAFTTIAGMPRRYVARLHPDGALDDAFNPNSSLTVHSLAIQADGKILVGGDFTGIGGGARNRLARLNTDGSLDGGFLVDVEGGTVRCLTVQTDGRILAGGDFARVNGEEHHHLAFLNPDGSLDRGLSELAMAPTPVASVSSLMVQADGRVLVGGRFGRIGDTPFTHLARLFNGPATQSLATTDSTKVRWIRGGTSPEVRHVTFDLLTDGVGNWTPLGRGTRIVGGWELAGLNLHGAGTVRARGLIGDGHGSNGLVESFASLPVVTLERWRLTHFGTTANAGAAADHSDPELDGIENILEFALGLDPHQNSAGQLPSGEIVAGEFVLSVMPPGNLTGISYGAESSAILDPGSWTPVPDTGTPPQHVFRVPIEPGPQLFLRLRITAQ